MGRNLALLQVAAVVQEGSALHQELANLQDTFKGAFRSVKNDGAYP